MDLESWQCVSVYHLSTEPDNLNREKPIVSKVGKIEVSFPLYYSFVSLSLCCGLFC